VGVADAAAELSALAQAHVEPLLDKPLDRDDAPDGGAADLVNQAAQLARGPLGLFEHADEVLLTCLAEDEDLAAVIEQSADLAVRRRNAVDLLSLHVALQGLQISQKRFLLDWRFDFERDDAEVQVFLGGDGGFDIVEDGADAGRQGGPQSGELLRQL